MRFHIDIPSAGQTLMRHVMEGHLEGPGLDDVLMHERARPPDQACYWMVDAGAACLLDPDAALQVGKAAGNSLLVALARAASTAGGVLVFIPEARA